MPKNRIAGVSEIKRFLKNMVSFQDFRMVRFLSENHKIVNSGLLLADKQKGRATPDPASLFDN